MTIDEKDYCYECANPWHLCICKPDAIKETELRFFNAKITYSKEWTCTGQNETQVEGFQDQNFLKNYLEVMGWRIISHEIIQEVTA